MIQEWNVWILEIQEGSAWTPEIQEWLIQGRIIEWIQERITEWLILGTPELQEILENVVMPHEWNMILVWKPVITLVMFMIREEEHHQNIVAEEDHPNPDHLNNICTTNTNILKTLWS